MVAQNTVKKIIDKVFDVVILIKSIFGFFEILAGIVLGVSGRLIESTLILALTKQEISEDPKDFIANYLIKIANNFSVGTHIFAVIYLIFHGVANIFLVVALAKKKTWAYHTALTGFGFFIVYQVYRYFHTHSLLLLLLTLFDIFIEIMILLEYRNTRKNKK